MQCRLAQVRQEPLERERYCVMPRRIDTDRERVREVKTDRQTDRGRDRETAKRF